MPFRCTDLKLSCLRISTMCQSVSEGLAPTRVCIWTLNCMHLQYETHNPSKRNGSHVYSHTHSSAHTHRHTLAGKILAVRTEKAAINLCWSVSSRRLSLHPLSMSLSLSLSHSQRRYRGQSITILMVWTHCQAVAPFSISALRRGRL